MARQRAVCLSGMVLVLVLPKAMKLRQRALQTHSAGPQVSLELNLLGAV